MRYLRLAGAGASRAARAAVCLRGERGAGVAEIVAGLRGASAGEGLSRGAHRVPAGSGARQVTIIWGNVVSAPNRWMAYWLRRRGWVCFYLDERCRQCGTPADGCWLALYQEGEERAK